jgi:hypothetical protein
MRIKEVKCNNKESIIIYVTRDEKNNEDIKKQIINYRKMYEEVSIFISGNNSIENLLRKIIQENRSE